MLGPMFVFSGGHGLWSPGQNSLAGGMFFGQISSVKRAYSQPLMIYGRFSMQQLFKAGLLSLAVVVSSGLSYAANAADGFTTITTEAEFRDLVVGRKMYLDDNYFTIKKNGALTGKFVGKTLKGAWAWRDGYWCRTISTHSKNTDCQLWEVNGDEFRATRERGKGKSFIYIPK